MPASNSSRVTIGVAVRIDDAGYRPPAREIDYSGGVAGKFLNVGISAEGDDTPGMRSQPLDLRLVVI